MVPAIDNAWPSNFNPEGKNAVSIRTIKGCCLCTREVAPVFYKGKWVPTKEAFEDIVNYIDILLYVLLIIYILLSLGDDFLFLLCC